MRSTPIVILLLVLLVFFLIDGFRSGANLSAQGRPPVMGEVGRRCTVHMSGNMMDNVTLKSIDPDWVIVENDAKRFLIPKETIRWVEIGGAGE